MREKMVEFAKTPVTRKQMLEEFKISDALAGYHLGLLVQDGNLKKVGKSSKTTYVKA
jgi:predicted HTH transcriptional regulator